MTSSRKAPPNPGEPIKLSKSSVDSISKAGIYPDTELKGFKLWVGQSGVKSYQLVGKAKGGSKTIFCTIGKHGDPWTPDSARREAERLRFLMKQGTNPNELRKDELRAKAEKLEAEAAEQRVRDLTFRVGFLKHTEKNQKESTVNGYKKVINAHLKDWLDKPLIDITQADVIDLFDRIHAQSPSSAAHSMRLLRAVFRTVQITYGESYPKLAGHNPVKILGHGRKDWNRLEPKQDYIADEDLPAFYTAVMALESQTARDYLMVCALTGMRMKEVCSLTWNDSIDLKRKTITIRRDQAKNKQRHMLAMSDFLFKLFLRRWESRESASYVFPGKSRQETYSKPETAIQKVIDSAQIPRFTSHSLRRTFATAADAVGYDLRSIQRLLNHKPGSVADRHYIQRHAEKTREPMQKITDHLLKLMQAPVVKPDTNVLPLIKKAT